MKTATLQREVLGNAAQHLQRAGFDLHTAAGMLGVSVRTFKEIATEAEQRRPRRCKGRCLQRPACPYCAACLELLLSCSVELPTR